MSCRSSTEGSDSPSDRGDWAGALLSRALGDLVVLLPRDLRPAQAAPVEIAGSVRPAIANAPNRRHWGRGSARDERGRRHQPLPVHAGEISRGDEARQLPKLLVVLV